MNTAFVLMARYDAMPIIPVDLVVKDFFPHMSTELFVRKTSTGEIKLPVVRIEPSSQKAAKGVHITDLAQYIDARRAAAVKEANQLAGV